MERFQHSPLSKINIVKSTRCNACVTRSDTSKDTSTKQLSSMHTEHTALEKKTHTFKHQNRHLPAPICVFGRGRFGKPRHPNALLTVAFEHDVVVRARMFRKISLEDGGDSANDAARVRVVFAGALGPFSGILDVDLARNMAVP